MSHNRRCPCFTCKMLGTSKEDAAALEGVADLFTEYEKQIAVPSYVPKKINWNLEDFENYGKEL